MENFDPLGIHTGDSIGVHHPNIVGERNIQDALDLHSERYCIIEVNARLSRSSALTSKATGYPLAHNSVTKTTTACFEPILNYCIVKMPRWDLKKFSRVSNDLASSMLSVGELARILTLRRAIPHYSLATVDERVLRVLKVNGFSDRQIAAEWPDNYLYITYVGSENDVGQSDEGIVVLGFGPYCISSSADFDWCAVSAVRTIRELDKPTIVVNCNPETVSTGYDENDRLYCEELTLERTLDIYDREQPEGVIVLVGGQIPNNLAMSLHKAGATILSTHPEGIDRCEDRNRFSALLDTLGIDQPRWAEVKAVDSALAFSADVGYSVLVRPSYVLSGAGMIVASGELQLREYLSSAAVVISRSVSISKFVLHAKEVEFDDVAKDGAIINSAISEHVENAGVRLGDATLALPA
ncbi:hypothetical protein PybrP1_011575 [[Pythium] brassicae (nom. inval.)]|nr:hypothetical protein PybrP1_011575 [[Pythium] brassicae (nom. inval.)]